MLKQHKKGKSKFVVRLPKKIGQTLTCEMADVREEEAVNDDNYGEKSFQFTMKGALRERVAFIKEMVFESMKDQIEYDLEKNIKEGKEMTMEVDFHTKGKLDGLILQHLFKKDPDLSKWFIMTFSRQKTGTVGVTLCWKVKEVLDTLFI